MLANQPGIFKIYFEICIHFKISNIKIDYIFLDAMRRDHIIGQLNGFIIFSLQWSDYVHAMEKSCKITVFHFHYINRYVSTLVNN